MALLAATVTAITRRHGVKYIAQITRDKTEDGYEDNHVTKGTVEEDVLETAVDQAKEAVREKVGTVVEGHWAVIELVPYFLNAPGEKHGEAHYDRVMARLTARPADSATTATAEDDDDSRRRYDGDDFENDANVQKLGRPRRSSF